MPERAPVRAERESGDEERPERQAEQVGISADRPGEHERPGRRGDHRRREEEHPRSVAAPIHVQVRADGLLARERQGERPAGHEHDGGHQRVGEEDAAPRLGHGPADQGDEGQAGESRAAASASTSSR